MLEWTELILQAANSLSLTSAEQVLRPRRSPAGRAVMKCGRLCWVFPGRVVGGGICLSGLCGWPFQALEKKGISHLEEKELKERNKRIQEDNRLELQKVGVPRLPCCPLEGSKGSRQQMSLLHPGLSPWGPFWLSQKVQGRLASGMAGSRGSASDSTSALLASSIYSKVLPAGWPEQPWPLKLLCL